MKKLFAFAALFALPVFAADLETMDSANISSPGSIKPMVQKIDRNNALLNAAVVAAQTSADAAITGITPTYTTNIHTFLDATTNAVAFTNITVRYTAVP